MKRASVRKSTTGTLNISVQPYATVQIDGVAAGEAPLSKQLPAGKHKVTFIVDTNKYTFTVNIKANEVTTLRKDFDALP